MKCKAEFKSQQNLGSNESPRKIYAFSICNITNIHTNIYIFNSVTYTVR